MKIKLNGKETELPQEALTLSDLLKLEEIDYEGKGIAVAVNWSVIPKSEWDSHSLHPDDEVEVITARQGG